jgi:hypothetical protein
MGELREPLTPVGEAWTSDLSRALFVAYLRALRAQGMAPTSAARAAIRCARLVFLRSAGGWSQRESAALLGCSTRTAERDERCAAELVADVGELVGARLPRVPVVDRVDAYELERGT